MRLALRSLALTAAFALIAGCGRFALAEASPSVSEQQMQHWSDWWLNEIERQYYPRPKWIPYYRFEHIGPMELAPTDGPIKVMATFKVHDAYVPELLIMWHLGLLNTEAFIPPSKTPPVYIRAQKGPGAFWYRISYELAELWGVSPRLDHRKVFPWRRNIRAFSTIVSTTFSTAQFEEANPFKLNTPNRLSAYGDDLRLFEYCRRFTTDNPFNSCLDLFGNEWPLPFLRWSPPGLDEMFSTPLPPAR